MMTNRQRMYATLAHQQVDRVPALIHARGEVQRALVEYYGVANYTEVLRLLGADTYATFFADVAFPDFHARTNGVLQGDAPGAGRSYIFHDERTMEDAWGVVRRLGSDRKYLEWVDGPLSRAEDPDEFKYWDQTIEPSVMCHYDKKYHYNKDNDQKSSIEGESVGQMAERIAALKQADCFVRVFVTQPYKAAWQLRGMEQVLMDYLINRPFLEKLYDRLFHTTEKLLEYFIKAGVDMIGFDGDIAMQDRIIMGPDAWREVDKPRLRALLKACKAINPAVVTFIHSDGDLSAIMPDLIEIGLEVIDPIQPECMDPAEVKRLYGDRITLHGCGSLQRTLPYGTPEDCRQEVRNIIDQCGRNGGLILRASNTIGFDVPVENVAAWYETARDYAPATLFMKQD
jgi:uroporphyrinogen decarboxylase